MELDVLLVPTIAASKSLEGGIAGELFSPNDKVPFLPCALLLCSEPAN
jgi:hypothetical protein